MSFPDVVIGWDAGAEATTVIPPSVGKAADAACLTIEPCILSWTVFISLPDFPSIEVGGANRKPVNGVPTVLHIIPPVTVPATAVLTAVTCKNKITLYNSLLNNRTVTLNTKMFLSQKNN